MKHLNELEKRALTKMNSGQHSEAIELFKQIISENPNYEFGACFYLIADCLEEIGDYPAAKEYYQKSINYDDEDTIRIGNYASFLYLHGKPEEAFDWYLRLFRLKKKYKMDHQKTLVAINSLAEKLGINKEQLIKILNAD